MDRPIRLQTLILPNGRAPYVPALIATCTQSRQTQILRRGTHAYVGYILVCL